jgi:hypothetical protein
MTVRYIGSGPYCYANSLAMMLGSAAPEPAVIEVLTGSPLVTDDRTTVARLLRRLAPTYEQLRASLPGG